jgi:ATP-dependent protease HslVU (ClpYQ) peptidase subunit
VTVVAAIARDGRIIMAADRQTNYQQQAIFGAKKIRRHTAGSGEVLIAASGAGAISNMVARHCKLDHAPDATATLAELQEWADVVAEAVTEVLANAQPPLIESGGINGALLLGVHGQLFYLFTHQAAHAADGVAALGSGSEVALGAMHAALRHGDQPLDAVLLGVELGCTFMDGCGFGPGGAPQIEEL